MTISEQITGSRQTGIDLGTSFSGLENPREPIEPLASKEKLQTPTLTFILELDISDILLRRIDGTRRFTVIQNQTVFTFELGRYPAVIFKQFFRGTHFPTIEEMTNKLPVNEWENFFDYLQELNEVIVDRLRITLEPDLKTVNGKTSSFLIAKQVPAPTERPKPPAQNNHIKANRGENGKTESNTTRIAERIKLADSIDPRRHPSDPRIPVRLLEMLTPTERKLFDQFFGTSKNKPLTLPEGGYLSVLIDQLNGEIINEGLVIKKAFNGDYYLLQIDEIRI